MLLTKLHLPALNNHIIHRPVLFNKLNDGLHCKLILVSAPAGFGKTTLIGDWIQNEKINSVWFSIDESDNDPVDFLMYLISGIRLIHSNFGQNAINLLQSANPPGFNTIINMIINEAFTINSKILIVLDDFHLINHTEILKLTTWFIDHLPENLHIAIVSRIDPNLPLARYRSKKQMIEIRASELSFSTNDIMVLFNKKLKIDISIDDAQLLENKTEGWIAGLQLTALSLSGQKDLSRFIEELKGSNKYIMDYLMEEVFKTLPDEIRTFLLKTCLLEQFSAPLCNAILNGTDSQTIIDTLDKNNMFVVALDDERKWYRYHHLFSDLLKQRLISQYPQWIENIHQQACLWFEKEGMYELAINHAFSIKDNRNAIRLIEQIVEKMWLNGHHAAILKYGALLPDDLIKGSPIFSLYYSWLLISGGQLAKANIFLQASAEGMKDNAESALQGKIYASFAYLYSYNDQFEKVFEFAAKAISLLQDNDQLWLIWVWYAYGAAYYAMGDIEESTKAYEKALNYGKSSGNIYLLSNIVIRMADNEQQLGRYKAGYKRSTDLLAFLTENGYEQLAKNEWSFAGLYSSLAVTETIWGETDKAYENIRIAYNLCKDGTDITLRAFVLMFYLGVLNIKGDELEEIAIAAEFEAMAKQNQMAPYLINSFTSWKAYKLFNNKKVDEAYQLLIDYGLHIDEQKTPVNDGIYSFLARILIERLEFNQAEKILDELYQLAVEGKRIERIVDLKMIYASLFLKLGDYPGAIKTMIEAMELASDENLLMFIAYNIDFKPYLLDEAIKSPQFDSTKISPVFIANIRKAIERKNNQSKKTQASDLSQRELETLKLMAENLSNQEIADKLFISLNTVKTHLKNIFIKLDVDSRGNAVSKAKKLELV